MRTSSSCFSCSSISSSELEEEEELLDDFLEELLDELFDELEDLLELLLDEESAAKAVCGVNATSSPSKAALPTKERLVTDDSSDMQPHQIEKIYVHYSKAETVNSRNS